MGRNYSDEAIKQLNYGQGQVLRGDAFLILLKALLQSGVGYLGGYPGAPVSGLYDAIEDAYQSVLKPLGVILEASGNEASAAALLAASVDNPIRGAINFKVVGTNVAADGLAHISASGVRGGTLIFVGEDYGLDSTSVAERTLPYALKSGILCIDPQGDAPTLARMVEEGFKLSEYSHALAFYLLRTRTGNLKGSIVCKDNQPPPISPLHPVERLASQITSFPIPPFSFEQERKKFTERLELAREYIREHHLNEVIPGEGGIGIITHGLIYNTTARALYHLGEADLNGRGTASFLVLNLIHPLVPQEITDFLREHRQVLVVEEGSPNLIEDQVRSLAQEVGAEAKIYGKDLLPRFGEYTPQVLIKGLSAFLAQAVRPRMFVGARGVEQGASPAQEQARDLSDHLNKASTLVPPLPARTPTFCVGCPERPIFSMLKVAEREEGRPYYASDSGCYAMGGFAPFFCADSYAGMGLGLATGAVASRVGQKKVVSFMGDGTFWHSGMATSIANATYNRQDAILFLFENRYTSMTGQQENPSTGVNPQGEKTSLNILKTLRGMGLKGVRVVNPYRLRAVLRAFRRATASPEQGLKAFISRGECMLERQREVRALNRERLRQGKTAVEEKFGVDGGVCREDRSCIRYNGCPALTLSANPNPLREDPVTAIAPACVGCQLCGELTLTLALCPAFYRARVITNPPWWRRLTSIFNRGLIRAVFRVPV